MVGVGKTEGNMERWREETVDLYMVPLNQAEGEWWEWVEVARINPDRQGKEGVKKYVQISPPPLTHSHRDLESGALFDGQNQQLLQDVGQENGQGSM